MQLLMLRSCVRSAFSETLVCASLAFCKMRMRMSSSVDIQQCGYILLRLSVAVIGLFRVMVSFSSKIRVYIRINIHILHVRHPHPHIHTFTSGPFSVGRYKPCSGRLANYALALCSRKWLIDMIYMKTVCSLGMITLSVHWAC